MCSLSPRGCYEGDVHVVLHFQHPDANYPIASDPLASFTPHARRERPRYIASPSVEAGSRSSWTGGRRHVRHASGLRSRLGHLPASPPSAPYTGGQGSSLAIHVMQHR